MRLYGLLLVSFGLTLTACESDRGGGGTPGSAIPNADSGVPRDTGVPPTDSGLPPVDGGATADGGIFDSGLSGSFTCDMPLPLPPTGIVITQIPQNAPTPSGGTIAQGSYTLSAINLFTGPGGQSGTLPLDIKGAVQVQGDEIKTSLSTMGGAAVTVAGHFSIAATTVTTTAYCATGTLSGSTFEFSATGGEIRLYSTSGGTTQEQIFSE